MRLPSLRRRRVRRIVVALVAAVLLGGAGTNVVATCCGPGEATVTSAAPTSAHETVTHDHDGSTTAHLVGACVGVALALLAVTLLARHRPGGRGWRPPSRSTSGVLGPPRAGASPPPLTIWQLGLQRC